MGENIRYFMYKYNLVYDDWFSNLNNIYIKIEAHVHNITELDDVCVAGEIREFCEARKIHNLMIIFYKPLKCSMYGLSVEFTLSIYYA